MNQANAKDLKGFVLDCCQSIYEPTSFPSIHHQFTWGEILAVTLVSYPYLEYKDSSDNLIILDEVFKIVLPIDFSDDDYQASNQVYLAFKRFSDIFFRKKEPGNFIINQVEHPETQIIFLKDGTWIERRYDTGFDITTNFSWWEHVSTPKPEKSLPVIQPDSYSEECIGCGAITGIINLGVANANGHGVYKCKKCEMIFSIGAKQ